jgi:hypothetical protein
MQPAPTQPTSPSTATLSQFVEAYNTAKSIAERQAHLLAQVEALPPRTRDRKVLITNAKDVLHELNTKKHEAHRKIKSEFSRSYCGNADRFENAVKEFKRVRSCSEVQAQALDAVLNAITNTHETNRYSEHELCNGSIMPAFTLSVRCYTDGIPDHIEIRYKGKNSYFSILSISLTTIHLYSNEPIAYRVSGCSYTTNTPAELHELSVACEVARAVLTCLQDSYFVSMESTTACDALKEQIALLSPAEETEPKE